MSQCNGNVLALSFRISHLPSIDNEKSLNFTHGRYAQTESLYLLKEKMLQENTNVLFLFHHSLEFKMIVYLQPVLF